MSLGGEIQSDLCYLVFPAKDTPANLMQKLVNIDSDIEN
jgi:hypothetical protein